MADVCYTLEAALEEALAMEERAFRNYLQAVRIVENRNAREILRGFALDELAHKHTLERALLDGRISATGGSNADPRTMGLDRILQKRELRADSDIREVMAYAVHLEKEAVEFYRRLCQGCAGAPMAGLFALLKADEERHVQAIEEMYETRFLPEN